MLYVDPISVLTSVLHTGTRNCEGMHLGKGRETALSEVSVASTTQTPSWFVVGY